MAERPDSGSTLQHQQLMFRQRVAASSLGGILTSLTMTPFDVVKTRMQAQAMPQQFSSGRCFLYCNGLMDHVCMCAPENGTRPPPWYRRPVYAKFNSSFDAAVKIGRHEGPLALYSGLTATLVLAIPSTVIYFTTLDLLKARLGYDPPHRTAGREWVPGVAAMCARLVAVLCMSPLELVRTQMQAQPVGWSSVWRALASDVASHGPISLWRGVVPSLLRDVPFSAIYWATFDSLRTWRLLSCQRESLTLPEAAAFGGIAGFVSGLVTLPFDVIKTHRQMQVGRASAESQTVLHSVRQVLQRSGPSGLFAGLSPRLLKVVPASAIMVGSFEYLKVFFSERNRRLAADGVEAGSG